MFLIYEEMRVDCVIPKRYELRDSREPISAHPWIASSTDANGTALFCAARFPPGHV